MTGLYPHQAGVGHMTGDYGQDGYRGDLNFRCVTIAEALKPAGYGTYMSGKWHVTRFTGPDGPKHSWPCQRGYDRYFGTIVGAGSFYTPAALTRDNTQFKAPEGFFYTHAINDNAAAFITDHHKNRPDDPFFIYIAHTAPHWPLHALKKDIAKYRGKYRKGWDALRAERHRRMIDMGIVRKEWAITPRDAAAHAWEDVDDAKKDFMDHKMAIYAAQIDTVDQGVGRVIDALKKTGRFENTLFLFLADNGGCAEGGIWGFDRNRKGELGTNDSFSSYGLSWANASNTPFRRYKHWVHEGGIATPLIAHWPARIRARGELRHEPGHLIDIMATCIDVSGATYPKKSKGNDVQPMEGKSLVPAFEGKPIGRSAPLFWEHEGNRAVRMGKWKLVAKGRTGPWELYDMEADRTELHDLAEKQPERVKQMADLWEAYALRTGVKPWPKSGGRGTGTSKKTSFALKQSDQLERHQAPMVRERPFTVVATINPKDPNGIIVAHGGTRCGWSLYLKDGTLVSAMRTERELSLVTAKEALPKGRVEVIMELAKDGTISFTVNGRSLGTAGKHPGALFDMPDEPLTVGADALSPIGDYERGTFGFKGRIESVKIDLGKR
jgi:arylsulfatase